MKHLLILVLGLVTAAGLVAQPKRERLVERFESCEAILREFQADPAVAIPREILARAKGIVVVNQFQGGLVFGIKDGYATALVKKPDGQWSVPALFRAGEASFGLQLGAKSVETIFVLMTEDACRLLFRERFNFGVDAKAVAGPDQAAAERASNILDAQVYVYSRAKGLYAGATLKTGFLTPDNEANRSFYNVDWSLPEILFSNWVTPPEEVTHFINYMGQLSP